MNKNEKPNQNDSRPVQQAKQQSQKNAKKTIQQVTQRPPKSAKKPAVLGAQELAKLFRLEYVPLIPSFFYIKDGYLYEQGRPGVPLCPALVVYAKVRGKNGKRGLVLKIKEKDDKEKVFIIGLDWTVEKILLKVAEAFDLSFTPKMLMSVLEYIASYERLNKEYIKEVNLKDFTHKYYLVKGFVTWLRKLVRFRTRGKGELHSFRN